MLLDKKYRIPVYLSLILCAILCLTMNLYGINVDEPVYATAGRIYLMWAEHPFQHNNRIDASWQYNHEHPPLGKLIGGTTLRLLHDGLGTVGLIKSFRVQNLIYCFAFCFVMYLWVKELTNKYIGVLAVLITFFLPRLYFNAHLGTLDYPITTLTFITSYAFLKGLDRPRGMILCSILIGLALLTKINAVLLYAFLGVWLIVAWRKELKSRLGYLLCFALIPAVMFVAFWPWLWPHPFARIMGYFVWMEHHAPIPVYYLGHTYVGNTPWHYPFVLAFVTLPVVLLLAIAFYAICARKNSLFLFLALSAVIPLASIAFLSPCRNSGVRLFLPCFPFFCMMGALGIHECVRRLTGKGVWIAISVIGVLIAGSISFAAGRYRRYQECYYNEVVAVTRTAPLLETEYEVGCYQELVPWLNEHPDSVCYVSCCDTYLGIYRIYGNLSESIRRGSYEEARYVVLLSMQSSFINDTLWDYYLHKNPLYAIRQGNGTPIVSIYKKE